MKKNKKIPKIVIFLSLELNPSHPDELAKTVADACTAALKPIPFPSRGTACVAKDSTYGAWNRAIVTDICEGDMISLLYLDYGQFITFLLGIDFRTILYHLPFYILCDCLRSRGSMCLQVENLKYITR
jgi:hypothetical protein